MATSTIVLPIVQKTGTGKSDPRPVSILEIANSYCILVVVYVRWFPHIFQTGFGLSILLPLHPSNVTDSLMRWGKAELHMGNLLCDC